VDVAANLAFQVAFKDAGNFQEVKIPVTLTVKVFAKTVVKKTKQVLSVLKGQTATVSFGNLNLPNSAFSANATVKVEVGKVPGEKNLDNNSASYPVFFSIPSGG
jgi:PPE-repeat protein